MAKTIQSSGDAPEKGADTQPTTAESKTDAPTEAVESDEDARRRLASRHALEMLERNLSKIYDLPI